MKKNIYNAVYWRIERRLHSFFLRRKIETGKITNLKLHFGCGFHKVPNMLNVDFRLNSVTDLAEDLSVPKLFQQNTVKEIFSNAFFEHIFRNKRIDHLKKVKNVLNETGFFCYIGIPYFKETVRYYLENDSFCNLDLVFGFTHGGGPIERMSIDSKVDMYRTHLHKSLYDENEIEKCLIDAGFKSYKIFKYSHPGEKGYKINLGFFGKKDDKVTNKEMVDECLNFLKKFDKEKILVETIEFLK